MKTFMKKLPRTVRIGPHDFKFELISHGRASGQQIYGMCEPNCMTIQIHSELASRAMAVDTVIHEISHAIFFAFHLNSGDGEERIVSMFGSAWTQIYRDNPALLRWIAEGVGHA